MGEVVPEALAVARAKLAAGHLVVVFPDDPAPVVVWLRGHVVGAEARDDDQRVRGSYAVRAAWMMRAYADERRGYDGI